MADNALFQPGTARLAHDDTYLAALREQAAETRTPVLTSISGAKSSRSLLRACIQLKRIVTAANCAPARKPVVTCGDGAEVLEPIEEALDQIAFSR